MLRGPSLVGRIYIKMRLIRDYILIQSHTIVNRDWYRTANPDVAVTGIDFVYLYAKYGWRVGRPLNPFFGGGDSSVE